MSNNSLNELQQLRLMPAKENHYDIAKAYDFVIGDSTPKQSDSVQVNAPCRERLDGIYFILSATKAVPISFATKEDKLKSIAVVNAGKKDEQETDPKKLPRKELRLRIYPSHRRTLQHLTRRTCRSNEGRRKQ